MFYCYNEIWHIHNFAEEKSSLLKACWNETEAAGLFSDVPSLLIQIDGSEEWYFIGQVKLEDNLVD